MRDTKHLEKHANKLAESKKEKELFRSQRKAVEAGAHGTLEYTIKKKNFPHLLSLKIQTKLKDVDVENHLRYNSG